MTSPIRVGSAVANELIRADRAFTGLELAAWYVSDTQAAEFLDDLEGIAVLHHDDGPMIVSDYGSFEQIVTLFIEIERPTIVDGSFCPGSANELVEQITDEIRMLLGYTNDTAEQEYATFVISCMLPQIDYQVAAGIWQQLLQNEVELDGELIYALTEVTINEHIAGVVEASLNVDLAELEGAGADGRSNHYFGIGERTRQFELDAGWALSTG